MMEKIKNFEMIIFLDMSRKNLLLKGHDFEVHPVFFKFNVYMKHPVYMYRSDSSCSFQSDRKSDRLLNAYWNICQKPRPIVMNISFC